MCAAPSRPNPFLSRPNPFLTRPNPYLSKPSPKNALALADPQPADQAVQALAAMTLSTSQIQVPAALASQDILQDHISAGVMSAQKANDLWRDLEKTCEKSVTAIDEAHESMKEAITLFRKDSFKQNNELAQLAQDLLVKLKTEALDPQAIDRIKLIVEVTRTVNQTRFDSVKQLSELHKMDLDVTQGGYKQVMLLMYDCRLKDIDAVSKMVLVAQSQEEHTQTIAVAYHAQQLKAESQSFEQFVMLAKFQQEAALHEREFDLKGQKQQAEQDEAFEDTALRRQVAESQMEQGKARLEMEARIEDQRHERALRQGTEQTRIAHRELDRQERRDKTLMDQYADEYALKRAQLKGQVEKDRFKHSERISDIESTERRQLAETRSKQILAELGIQSFADLEHKKLDAATMLKLKEMSQNGRCSIV